MTQNLCEDWLSGSNVSFYRMLVSVEVVGGVEIDLAAEATLPLLLSPDASHQLLPLHHCLPPPSPHCTSPI